MDISAPLAAREQQLAVLAALPLQKHTLLRVREQCLRAHRGLLEAEREQSVTSQRLDGAGRAPLTQAELAALQERVRRAGDALRTAQAQLPGCERGTRELALRYR